MNTLIIMSAGVTVAFLARPAGGRGRFTLADLGMGLLGGVVGKIVAAQLSVGAGMWELGWPLLIVCGLTLGLQSVQQRRA
jgi:hypothetical protein